MTIGLALARWDRPALSRALAAGELYITLGLFTARLRASSAAVRLPLMDHLAGVYAPVLARRDARSHCHHLLDLKPTNLLRRFVRPQVRATADPAMPATPLPARLSALAFEMTWNLKVALGHFNHVILHASVVDWHGRAVIMPAGSGSGKSTLAALLMDRGARLLSDEFGLVDLATAQLAGFPRAVSLKNQSIDIVRNLADRGDMSAPLDPTPKGAIAYAGPRASDISNSADVPAAMIVFPRFDPDLSTPEIEEISPAAAFTRLINSSTNYQITGEAGFDALRKVVSAAPAFAIRYANSGDALRIFDQLGLGGGDV